MVRIEKNHAGNRQCNGSAFILALQDFFSEVTNWKLAKSCLEHKCSGK